MEIDIKRITLNVPPNSCLILDETTINKEISVMKMSTEERRIILRKYFLAWRRRIRYKREKAELMKTKLEQREKLDNLMKALKKHKKQQEKQQFQAENDKNNKTKNKVTADFEINKYKSRFEAQKNAIAKLALQLEERDKLIEDLKAGIYDKESLEILNNDNKINIHEIFKHCSVKVRCKKPPPPDYSEKFMVTTRKAPKILQQVEQRAMERAQRREIIIERKRAIEEKRKKIIAEALEKKRVQDEEEKKRNLELIKERRKKELEMEKIRHANKVAFLEKWDKAINLYNNRLLEKSFKKILVYKNICKYNYKKSQQHYTKKLLELCINKWKGFVEDKYYGKYALADALFSYKIQARAFKTWHEVKLESVRKMQVAEDYYDFHLQLRAFLHFHRYVCIQYVIRDKQMKMAQAHYNRRTLFHYFYQWRSLPAVIQLEKAKEEKKRRWREKVWEILPDYKPPIDF